MNGRVARAIRNRTVINPKEKSIDKKLVTKLKREYYGKPPVVIKDLTVRKVAKKNGKKVSSKA